MSSAFYVIVRGDQGGIYYPNNTHYKFQVHFATPLLFQGDWNGALVEFSCIQVIKGYKELYIYSNIFGESVVDGTKQPLIRRILNTKGKGWNVVMASAFYLPLKVAQVMDLEVYIKDETGEYATVLTSPVSMTLHFRRSSFLL